MAAWDENGRRSDGGGWRTPSALRRLLAVAVPLGFVAWSQSFPRWDFEHALDFGLLVWVSLWITVWWPWSPTRRRVMALLRDRFGRRLPRG